MAKRPAEKQINNQGRLESEDEEKNETIVADALVIAKRKILAPKRLGRKLNLSANGDLNRDARVMALNEQFLQAIQTNTNPNTVADFTSIAQKYITYYSSLSSDANPQSAANNSVPAVSTFNFGAQSLMSPKPSAFSLSKPVLFLGSKPTASKPGNSTAGATPTGFAGFGNLSHKPLSTGIKTSSDTTNNPIFPNAENSASTVVATSDPRVSESAQKQMKITAAKVQADAIEVDSTSSSDEEIEIKGPQFTLAAPPVTKNSPFTFGPKPVVKKDDSDSESEIEIKGPTFSIDKPIKDTVFKFDKPALSQSTPAFSFAPKKVADPKIHASSLKEASPSTTPRFSFPTTSDMSSTLTKRQDDDPSNAKPFSFGNSGSQGAIPQAAPFSFASNKVESDSTSLKPKLFDSASAESASSTTINQAKPSPFGGSVKFGSGTAPVQASPNSISVAEKSSSTFGAKPFSFGNNDASKASVSSPPAKLFSFAPAAKHTSSQDSVKDGSTTLSVNAFNGAKPFLFGTSSEAKKPESTPISFGSQATSDQTPSAVGSFPHSSKNGDASFGASQASNGISPEGEDKDSELASKTAPGFTFGGIKSNGALTDAKPLFQFSNLTSLKSTTDSVPKSTNPLFSFKPSLDSASNPAPSFNFRPNSVSADQPETKDVAKPSFSFAANDVTSTTKQPPAFNFGSSVIGALAPSAAFTFTGAPKATEQAGNDADEKLQEEESTAQFKPVATLSSAKVESPITGEEGEEVLYSQRAKLMLFDPQLSDLPYTNKGLGDLKVLKSLDTGKSRIVIRADGGLRVLLNAPVSKDMTYSTVGTKMVRVPTINPETKKIEFYVFQVKTPEDASQFLETLNSVKG